MERTQDKQVINITEPLMNRINELISHYPADKRKSALLPVLHEVQDAHENWLSTELMDKVAEIIQVLPIEVWWYLSHYVQSKPVGKYLFEFCQTSPCCLNGTEDLMDYTCEN
jgi:NADH-quinone oxidoreductase subunit E